MLLLIAKVTLVVGLVHQVTRRCLPHAPAIRHQAIFAAFCVCLLLTMLALSLPAWQLPLLPARWNAVARWSQDDMFARQRQYSQDDADQERLSDDREAERLASNGAQAGQAIRHRPFDQQADSQAIPASNPEPPISRSDSPDSSNETSHHLATPQRIEMRDAGAGGSSAASAQNKPSRHAIASGTTESLQSTERTSVAAHHLLHQLRRVLDANLLVSSVTMVWAAVFMLLVGRYAFTAIRMAWLVRTSRPATITDGDQRQLALDEHRRVRVVVHAKITTPFVCGVLYPVVVLPESSRRWTDTQRRLVIRHELAHVERQDLLTYSIAYFVCSIYWFHPLMWMLLRTMREDRELACDEEVISAGESATDYADLLLAIAAEHLRQRSSRYRFPPLRIDMAVGSRFEHRIEALLTSRTWNVERKSQTVLPRMCLVLALLLGFIGTRAEVRESVAGEVQREAVPQDSSDNSDPKDLITDADPEDNTPSTDRQADSDALRQRTLTLPNDFPLHHSRILRAVRDGNATPPRDTADDRQYIATLLQKAGIAELDDWRRRWVEDVLQFKMPPRQHNLESYVAQYLLELWTTDKTTDERVVADLMSRGTNLIGLLKDDHARREIRLAQAWLLWNTGRQAASIELLRDEPFNPFLCTHVAPAEPPSIKLWLPIVVRFCIAQQYAGHTSLTGEPNDIESRLRPSRLTTARWFPREPGRQDRDDELVEAIGGFPLSTLAGNAGTPWYYLGRSTQSPETFVRERRKYVSHVDRTLVAMFDSSFEHTLPAFARVDGSGRRYVIVSRRVDWQAAWEKGGELIDAVAGDEGFFADVIASIKSDPNGPRFDLQTDLLNHLDSPVTIVAQLRPISVTSDSAFAVVISLRDPTEIRKTIERWTATDAMIRKQEIDGVECWSIGSENQDADRTQSTLFGIYRDQLVIGSDRSVVSFWHAIEREQ
jgi:hypothetical protein